MSTHATVIFTDNWEHEPVPTTLLQATGEVVPMPYVGIGIAEVRAITSEAYRRPLTGEVKTIVVRAPNITLEAQQAFLKTLEEPPASTTLVLILPVGTTLLPTIRSRVQVLQGSVGEVHEVFQTWLSEPLSERLARVDQAAKQKDDVFFAAMSQGLRHYLSEERRTLPPAVQQTAFMVMSLLRTRGASNKMLLEELALSLPVS